MEIYNIVPFNSGYFYYSDYKTEGCTFNLLNTPFIPVSKILVDKYEISPLFPKTNSSFRFSDNTTIKKIRHYDQYFSETLSSHKLFYCLGILYEISEVILTQYNEMNEIQINDIHFCLAIKNYLLGSNLIESINTNIRNLNKNNFVLLISKEFMETSMYKKYTKIIKELSNFSGETIIVSNVLKFLKGNKYPVDISSLSVRKTLYSKLISDYKKEFSKIIKKESTLSALTFNFEDISFEPVIDVEIVREEVTEVSTITDEEILSTIFEDEVFDEQEEWSDDEEGRNDDLLSTYNEADYPVSESRGINIHESSTAINDTTTNLVVYGTEEDLAMANEFEEIARTMGVPTSFLNANQVIPTHNPSLDSSLQQEYEDINNQV